MSVAEPMRQILPAESTLGAVRGGIVRCRVGQTAEKMAALWGLLGENLFALRAKPTQGMLFLTRLYVDLPVTH